MQLEHAWMQRAARWTLSDASLAVTPGRVLAIVGPNGSGKSTLLGLLSGRLHPQRGRALLDGRILRDWPPVALARRRAVLSQQVPLTFGFSVREVVQLGRSPYPGAGRTDRDAALIDEALALADAQDLAGRRYLQLSGGERQRVQLARVFAQVLGASTAPRFLLLDEPEASLDIAHQQQLMSRLRHLASRGLGVAVVLHDINLAARHADDVALLHDGRIQRIGCPEEALEPLMLSKVYGIHLRRDRLPGQAGFLLSPI